MIALLLPFVFAPFAATAAALAADETVVICTPDGVKRIAIDGSEPEPPSGADGPLCPICLAVGSWIAFGSPASPSLAVVHGDPSGLDRPATADAAPTGGAPAPPPVRAPPHA